MNDKRKAQGGERRRALRLAAGSSSLPARRTPGFVRVGSPSRLVRLAGWEERRRE
jgi:hypothetical protein